MRTVELGGDGRPNPKQGPTTVAQTPQLSGRLMVEFPAEEARALTGKVMDRDLEERALRRIEGALRIEEGSCGSLHGDRT